MTPQNERPHDDPLETLLAAASRDSPAPDAGFLGRLRERSTEAFVAASSPLTIPLPRRRCMVTFLSRSLAPAAALLVLFGGLLYWRSLYVPPPFGRVVEKLNEAKTLHLRVAYGDHQQDVWVSQPHRWRRE